MSVNIISEVAGAHFGSMALARQYIRVFVGRGADTIKFQCHPEGGPRPTFTPDEWLDLAATCSLHNVEFLVTPFTPEAVEMLNPMVERWKVASGHVTDRALLRAMADTKKPVLLSTGMSAKDEIETALVILGRATVTILECVSLYPPPPGVVRVVPEILPALGPWGLSDHSRQFTPSILAVRAGASVVEVHVMLPSKQPFVDAPVSWYPNQFARLVREIRFVEKMPRTAPDKDGLLRHLGEARAKYLVETS